MQNGSWHCELFTCFCKDLDLEKIQSTAWNGYLIRPGGRIDLLPSTCKPGSVPHVDDSKCYILLLYGLA